MSGMFAGCWNINNLNLSGFNTSNVTNMEEMFSECYGLTSLDIRNFNTNKVTNMKKMFKGGRKLTIIQVGTGWTTENADTTDMFADCGVSDVTRM